MKILVYRTAAGYLLLDERMCPPQLVTPAELVLSVSTSHAPSAVTSMLEHALEENGPLQLQDAWADHLFGDRTGWERRDGCLAGLVAG